jgi:hypothetical protein
VIALFGGKLQRHDFLTEVARHRIGGFTRGTRSEAGPEVAARRIPDAVARAFLIATLGQRLDAVDQAARAQVFENRGERRLLATPLRIAKARQHGLAIEHDSRVGREHHVRLTRRAFHDFNLKSGPAERFPQGVERRHRAPMHATRVASPRPGVHPGIDAVGNVVEGGRYQEDGRAVCHGGGSLISLVFGE